MRRRRTVLMEYALWRSGRIGGAAWLETLGELRCREALLDLGLVRRRKAERA